MTHTFKLMVIDDSPGSREKQYRQVLSATNFDPLYVWTRDMFEQNRNLPVDGYIIDIFLEKGDWADTNAAELLRDAIQTAPRPAPVFLVSQFWADERVLGVLKQVGESSAKVVQYLAWSEFEEAIKKGEAGKGRMAALRNKLLFELSHWYCQSGFRPGPGDTIRVLLLADMQFGDPDTDPNATFAEHRIAHALSQEHNLPDLIAIAGDVSYSGRPDQFALAQERIELDLMGPLWGTNNIDRYRDRIVIVPGNHDVNLRFSACDNYRFNLTTKRLEDETVSPTPTSGHSLCHHGYALEPFRRFARDLTGDKNWEMSQSLSWVDRRFLHCGIRFFVMNSVAGLNSSMPGHASFDESALRGINRSLFHEESASIFSIALSHHGVRPDGAPHTETEVDNWIPVGRDVFSMHGICLWLYGHYHEFYTRSLNGAPFHKTPLWLVQVPTSRISPSARGFCVLELHRESGSVSNVQVHHYVFEHGTAQKRHTRRLLAKG